ncbi:MAG TPA: thioredoxin domain-containing protein, partial [Vicinamibacterales bacterium]
RDHMPSYLFALSTIGLAVVFYLGYASFFVLKAVCLICLATYVGVIGLFITTGSASDVPMTRLPRLAAGDLGRLRRNPLALGVAVFAIAMAGAAVALFPHAGVGSTVSAAAATTPPLASSEESAFEHWFSEQPRAALDVPRGEAKVLVVKFNDYQCPPCRHAYETYKSIYEKYASEHPGAVKLVYLDYPLDSSCNDNVLGGGPHPSACDAAVAVRLAEEKGKKPEMQQWLFDNQPSLSGASIREALKEIANVTNFDARYPEVIKLVKADIARGHQLGVHATPTFFIDGVRIEGALQPQYFDAAIAYELDHAKSGK